MAAGDRTVQGKRKANMSEAGIAAGQNIQRNHTKHHSNTRVDGCPYCPPHACTSAVQALKVHGWIQGVYGSEEQGFCIVGAWSHAYKTGQIGTFAKLSDKLADYLDSGKEYQDYGLFNIGAWQDLPTRQLAEVIEALEYLGEKEE